MKSLENQIFKWESWDLMETACFIFYDITLVVPIDKFPIGTKFESAFWSNETSILQFYNGDEVVWTSKLKVSIEQ